MSDDKLTMGSANRLLAMIPKKPHGRLPIGMGMTIARPEALHSMIKDLKTNGTRLLLDASSIFPLFSKKYVELTQSLLHMQENTNESLEKMQA